MRLARGATRDVFLIGSWAFKIPSLRSWRNFLLGLLANLQEREFAKLGWSELCPVSFSLPGGLLVVMPRAGRPCDHYTDTDYLLMIELAKDEGRHLPVEYKESSFGILGGSLVIVDYGS